ncbi:MAG: hypothetical protein M0Q24_00305 [Sulfurimonas sp.]|uniref:calcium-binding protein n=1 Tax=Sulfurimonas sp. TaxID=2022749 RepID=UPI0025CD92CC|nr:calcium-binding protein [Sulfurimonas sp.]MCK9490501.1 hypothetical protein [Sulfurimonas sp.]
MSLDLNSSSVEYKNNKVIIKSIPKDGENLSVFMRPGDEVVFDIEGLNSDELEYILIGGDIVVSFANEGVLTFPSLGLMGFSSNPPYFNFGSNKTISVDNILSKIEEVNELPITSVDASFKVTTSNNEENEAPTGVQVVVLSQNEGSAGTGAKTQDFPQGNAPFSPNHQPDPISRSTPTSDPFIETMPKNDFDAYKQDSDLVPPPDVDLVPDGGGSSDPDDNTGDNDLEDIAKPAFYFKATAHQVTYSETTDSDGTPLILGGGGSLEGYESDSKEVQFMTETIDMSARNEDMVIRAENSTYFDNNPTGVNYLSRVLKFTPQMPEGYFVDSFSITGLPTGMKLFDKNGNEISGSTITKNQMIFKDDLGNVLEYGNPNFIIDAKNVEFTVKYNDDISDPFNISITANYKLDPAYYDTTDLAHTRTHENEYTIALKDITEADDYVYNKSDFVDGADEGFIFSKEANTNTIKDGSGNSTIVGGIGTDIVYLGSGDDTVYLSAGSDTVYSGAGNNFIDGDNYLREDGTTKVQYTDGRDKVSYAEVKSYSLAELKYLNDNNYITPQEYLKLTGGYKELDDDGNAIANPIDIEMLKHSKGVYVDLEGFTYGATTWIDTDNDGVLDTEVNNNEVINALSKFALKEDFEFTYNEDGDVTGVTGTNIPQAGLENIQLVGQDKFVNIEDIDGSAYNDIIYGNNSKNIISGLGGSDILDGRGGGNELYGGEGSDTLYSGSGNDKLDGGDGTDTVNYQNSTSGVIVRLDKPNGDEFEDYSTGHGDDTLISIEDVIGSEHNDIIYGNDGTNYLRGMGGDDKFISGKGYDFIDGGAGSDYIGYHETDYLASDLGKLNPNFMEEIDGIRVTMGTDYVMVKETETDRLIDLIKDIEQVSGTKGNDYIWGNSSNETFWGHEGNDDLRGWGGNDTLYGGAGDDFLLPGAGKDHSDGGDGVDFLYLYHDALKNKTQQWIRLDESGTVQYTIDLTGTPDTVKVWNDGYDTNSGGVNTAINIEGLHGSSGADYIIGNSQNNRFEGHNGDDVIYGMAGDDSLNGGGGDDELYGGEGNDIIYGHSAHNWGLTNNDIIDGGNGIDTLNYNSSAYGFILDMSVVVGGYSTVDFSTLLPTAHLGKTMFNDQIKGIENIHGSRGNDTITGDANANIINGWWGNDTIYGGGGDDKLYGGTYVDTIYGGDGDDYINLDQYSDTDTRVHAQNNEYAYGGDGNDTIVSQGGRDHLYGEAGDDTFSVRTIPYNIHGGSGTDKLELLGDINFNHYHATTSVTGLEELSLDSHNVYFNYEQFFTDNTFSKVEGGDNSQLIVYGTTNSDTFDISGINFDSFSGKLIFDASSGTDTLKMGTDQSVNMNQHYYNSLEIFDIGANSELNVIAHDNNGRPFHAHDRDFTGVDSTAKINLIGGTGNDSFYTNFEALLAGKLTVDGKSGSDIVDIRTDATNTTFTFNDASDASGMFSNIERLEFDQISDTNSIYLNANDMSDWLSADNNLILDLNTQTQADNLFISNAVITNSLGGSPFTGFEIGKTYDITPNDDISFTMQVV